MPLRTFASPDMKMIRIVSCTFDTFDTVAERCRAEECIMSSSCSARLSSIVSAMASNLVPTVHVFESCDSYLSISH